MSDNFSSPEVRVEEVRKGTVSITGQADAIGGFLGVTRKGLLDTPIKVASFPDAEAVFGSKIQGNPLMYDLELFFANGGKYAYVCSIASRSSPPTTTSWNLMADLSVSFVLSASSPRSWSANDRVTTVKRDTVITTLAVALPAYVAPTAGVEDGTLAETYNVANGTMDAAVDGGAPQTLIWTCDPATLTTPLVGTFAVVVGGNTLDLTVNGAPQSVAFTGAEASRTDFINTINGAAVGVTASAGASPTSIVLSTTRRGTGANITVLGSSDADVLASLGFAGAETDTGAGPASNSAAATGAEVAAWITAGLIDAVGSYTGAVLHITSSTTGSASSIQVSAGAIQAVLGFDTTLHSGTAGLTTYSYADLTSSARVRVGDLLKFGASTYGTVTAINGNRVYFSAAAAVGGVLILANVSNCTFDLTVYDENGSVRPAGQFTNLRMSALSSNYYYNVINNTFRTPVTAAASGLSTGDTRPDNVTSMAATVVGTDGSTAVGSDYVGTSVGTGIYAFDSKSDMTTLSIPEAAVLSAPSDQTLVQRALIERAEARKSYVALLNFPLSRSPSQAVTWVETTTNTYSGYMAWVYPNLKVVDSVSGSVIVVPPTGAIQGIVARTWRNRNQAKAPAGVIDGAIAGIVGVEREVSQEDYDLLYPAKINAIRVITGYGTCFMGNATADPTGEVPELGVRLFLLWYRKAVKNNTLWVNFEGNTRTSRAKATAQVEAFNMELFRKEMLEGDKFSESSFVVCNETNNDATVRAARKFYIRIGLAVVHASEFVYVTIEQDTRALDAARAQSGT